MQRTPRCRPTTVTVRSRRRSDRRAVRGAEERPPTSGTRSPTRRRSRRRPAAAIPAAGGRSRIGERRRPRAQLSDRVRRDEIYAFVEIPADALDPDHGRAVRYYSNHPAYRLLPDWISTTVNREVVNRRFRSASIDRAMVDSPDPARSTWRSSVCLDATLAAAASGRDAGRRDPDDC